MPSDCDTHLNDSDEQDLSLSSYLCRALYAKMHFLALPLGRLDPVPDPRIRLIGTDGEKLFFCAPSLFSLLRSNEDAALLYFLHEILHCLLGHPFVRGVNPESFDLAADLTVWKIAEALYPGGYRLVPSLLSSPEDSLSWADISPRLPEAQTVTVSDVSRLLLDDSWFKERQAAVRHLLCRDDHRFWPSRVEDPALPNRPGSIGANCSTGSGLKSSESLRHRWQSMNRSLNRELHRLHRTQGTADASYSLALTLTGEQRYLYRDFLHRFASMQENTRVNADEFSYPFYQIRLGQAGNVRLIEPLEYTEEEKLAELAIVIDTSGSCQGDPVRVFLEETRNILLAEDLFFSRFHLEIIQCDNRVQRTAGIRSSREFEDYIHRLKITGGGGTDYRPAFSYIEQMIREGSFSHLKGILYFTDGCGIYPKEKPSYETVFILPENRYDAIEVPSWAMKLVIPVNSCKTQPLSSEDSE